jgi:hypothetical protein
MVARRPEASRERGYTNDELQECVDMVLKENMTQAKARAAMNAKGVVIPKGTLHGYVCDVRKTHGMVKKKLTVGTRLGPPTLLTKSQEQRLYNSIFEHDLAGEPMTKERVKEVAWVLSEIDHLVWKCNPLPNQGLCTGQLFGPSGPSDKWFRSFAKRWKLNAEPWNVRRRGSTLISRTRR